MKLLHALLWSGLCERRLSEKHQRYQWNFLWATCFHTPGDLVTRQKWLFIIISVPVLGSECTKMALIYESPADLELLQGSGRHFQMLWLLQAHVHAVNCAPVTIQRQLCPPYSAPWTHMLQCYQIRQLILNLVHVPQQLKSLMMTKQLHRAAWHSVIAKSVGMSMGHDFYSATIEALHADYTLYCGLWQRQHKEICL